MREKKKKQKENSQMRRLATPLVLQASPGRPPHHVDAKLITLMEEGLSGSPEVRFFHSALRFGGVSCSFYVMKDTKNKKNSPSRLLATPAILPAQPGRPPRARARRGAARRPKRGGGRAKGLTVQVAY